MPSFDFTLIMSPGTDPGELAAFVCPLPQVAVQAFERGGQQVLTCTVDDADVDRTRALLAVVAQLRASGLHPVRLAETGLVCAPDVASLAHFSSEGLRRYIQGTRGPGAFPPPLNPGCRAGQEVYLWADTAAWFTRHGIGKPEHPVEVPDRTYAVVNLLLAVGDMVREQPELALLAVQLLDDAVSRVWSGARELNPVSPAPQAGGSTVSLAPEC